MFSKIRALFTRTAPAATVAAVASGVYLAHTPCFTTAVVVALIAITAPVAAKPARAPMTAADAYYTRRRLRALASA